VSGEDVEDSKFVSEARRELALALVKVLEKSEGRLPQKPPDGRVLVLKLAEGVGGMRSVVVGDAALSAAADIGRIAEADLQRKLSEAQGIIVVGVFETSDGRAYADVMDILLVPVARAKA